MSKGFRNKKCVYCNQRDSTRSGDHVFPRRLFLVNRRANLPKVPCCTKCNNQKSRLEANLLAILPFGANHSDALENLTTNVPKRLKKNIKLYRELRDSMSKAFIKNEAGILEPMMIIEFDINQLFDLFNYITRALVHLHFNTKMTSQHFIKSFITAPVLNNFFNGSAQERIEQDLGNGTVWYRGIQAKENQSLTLWEYKIYGGLQLLDQLSGNINSYTCRNEIQHKIDLRTKFDIKVDQALIRQLYE